jgi:hypothetical protein
VTSVTTLFARPGSSVATEGSPEKPHNDVIPAKAGEALERQRRSSHGAVAKSQMDDQLYHGEAIPAFAGMTTKMQVFEAP